MLNRTRLYIEYDGKVTSDSQIGPMEWPIFKIRNFTTVRHYFVRPLENKTCQSSPLFPPSHHPSRSPRPRVSLFN